MCLRATFFISALLAAAYAGPVSASPNLARDHPVYDQLLHLEALGLLASPTGGFWPLSEFRAEWLLRGLGIDPASPLLTIERPVWWVSPLRRVALHAELARDEVRPYSTAAHPRNLVGGIAVTCERREGLPCGEGASSGLEFESSTGYGPWISATLRLRGTLGTDERASEVAIDRAYVAAELGPFAAEVGRDVFALGPASRTQLGWSVHATPLDHVRISSARPWAVTPALRLNGQYILGRLRAPQRYPGNLVSIMRGQVDLGRTIEVGLMQMLQLGGDGARELGLVDFLLEHVRRRDISAGETDSSNRRFGGDFSARIASLAGLRLYYQLMFEDIRRARWLDAIRYDADHLVGLELAAIGPGRRHSIVLEWQHTGVRSQEHGARTNGFTNAGSVVGSPLGPDAGSVFLGARVVTSVATFFPWLELAQLSSDTYQFVDYGPINRTATGEDEVRYRAALRARMTIEPGLSLEAEALIEHVDDLAFVPGRARNNIGLSASLVWYSTGALGTLSVR